MRTNKDRSKLMVAGAVALAGVLAAGTMACAGDEADAESAVKSLGAVEAGYVSTETKPAGYALTTLPTSGVVVAGSTGVICYSHDGDEEWRFELPDGEEVVASPAIAPDSTTYILSSSSLVSISIKGEVLWSIAVDPAEMPAVVALGDSTVVVTSGDNALVNYSSSGKRQWRFELPDGDTIKSLPRASNNSQIFVQGAERLYVVEPSGLPFWDRPL